MRNTGSATAATTTLNDFCDLQLHTHNTAGSSMAGLTSRLACSVPPHHFLTWPVCSQQCPQHKAIAQVIPKTGHLHRLQAKQHSS
jgi:hypothetical protein